jgi:hypothetical protein
MPTRTKPISSAGQTTTLTGRAHWPRSKPKRGPQAQRGPSRNLVKRLARREREERQERRRGARTYGTL